MQRISIQNEQYIGAEGKASLYDLSIPENWNKKLIIFSHGYMGYKDWGAWNMMGDFFIQRGYGFLKYNVSHNGGTAENGIDFPDLASFSKNCYSKELADMESIIQLAKETIDHLEHIYLLGHSRGGGMVLLQSQHVDVSKIAALAPISNIARRFPSGDELADWKNTGNRFTTNGRTKQQMPHAFSQYEDYIEHQKRLDIESYSRNSKVPVCVIHGEADPAVKIEEGKKIADWSSTKLIRIPDEQHTFGARQPWTENTLPQGLQIVCQHLFEFFE